MPSQASLQAPGEPGRTKMKVAPATPAAGPRLHRRRANFVVGNAMEDGRETSVRFSNRGSSASGVTSRPVKPVPPVVITTSIAGSAIQAARRELRIASTSSRTMARSASSMPGLGDAIGQGVARLVDRQNRVSDTVKTAIFSATKAFPHRGPALFLSARRCCGIDRAALQAVLQPARAVPTSRG